MLAKGKPFVNTPGIGVATRFVPEKGEGSKSWKD